jgi:hypothetical protein
VSQIVVPIADQERARILAVVVEFGQVAPLGPDAWIDRIDGVGADEFPGFVADEDLGPLLGQHRVLGGVIDDQIGHHLQAVAGGLGQEAGDLRVVAFAIWIAEAGIETERVLDGVEAAGKARLVEWVHVNPIELHARDARQLGAPRRDRADEERKQVVNPRSCRCGRAGFP